MIWVLAAMLLFAVRPGAAQVSVAADGWPDEQACQNQAFDEPALQAWCIAIDTTRGNCIACHAFNISPWPPGLPAAGNIAPPMVAMRARFPDPAALHDVIAGSATVNPRAIMPPYLRHGILESQEIDLLVEFLLAL